MTRAAMSAVGGSLQPPDAPGGHPGHPQSRCCPVATCPVAICPVAICPVAVPGMWIPGRKCARFRAWVPRKPRRSC